MNGSVYFDLTIKTVYVNIRVYFDLFLIVTKGKYSKILEACLANQIWQLSAFIEQLTVLLEPFFQMLSI